MCHDAPESYRSVSSMYVVIPDSSPSASAACGSLSRECSSLSLTSCAEKASRSLLSSWAAFPLSVHFPPFPFRPWPSFLPPLAQQLAFLCLHLLQLKHFISFFFFCFSPANNASSVVFSFFPISSDICHQSYSLLMDCIRASRFRGWPRTFNATIIADRKVLYVFSNDPKSIAMNSSSSMVTPRATRSSFRTCMVVK